MVTVTPPPPRADPARAGRDAKPALTLKRTGKGKYTLTIKNTGNKATAFKLSAPKALTFKAKQDRPSSPGKTLKIKLKLKGKKKVTLTVTAAGNPKAKATITIKP